ncbi:hypothetical protein Tco_1158038 [Tanacetum coccineum]
MGFATTSTPDNEVTYMTETEVREFNAKLEKKHVNNKYNMDLEKLLDQMRCLIPLPSIFDSTPEDVEGKPLYNRFVKTDRIKAVPPPLSGNYIPLSDPTDLDESQMTYGPKQTYTSDSEPKTIDLDSCESNSSVESLESMPKPCYINHD